MKLLQYTVFSEINLETLNNDYAVLRKKRDGCLKIFVCVVWKLLKNCAVIEIDWEFIVYAAEFVIKYQLEFKKSESSYFKEDIASSLL